jgi:hypothetical protein
MVSPSRHASRRRMRRSAKAGSRRGHLRPSPSRAWTRSRVCHGTARYVRKIGGPAPLVERHDWIFTMRGFGGEWKIDGVTTAQASGWSAWCERGDS